MQRLYYEGLKPSADGRRPTVVMRLDLVHLARSLRRSPTSAAAAVVTLALTIGAGTSIFAVVDAVLLTPPPFADPDALVFLGETPLGDESAAPRAVIRPEGLPPV